MDLLSRGLAHVSSHHRPCRRAGTYKAAEAEAREKGAGFWGEGINPAGDDDEEVLEEPVRVACFCSHFGSLRDFYLRITDAGDALDDQISQLKEKKPAVDPLPVNTICLGLFEGRFYRCKVLRKGNNGYRVRFLDYGNEEDLPLSDLRQCPSAVAEKPPMAFKAALEGVILPPAQSEYEADAEAVISEYLEKNKKLKVTVYTKRGGLSYCVVSRTSDPADSLNV